MTRKREKSLSDMIGFVLRRDESEKYLRVGIICGHAGTFASELEREHFTKFLEVEIFRTENKISRLNKALEEL